MHLKVRKTMVWGNSYLEMMFKIFSDYETKFENIEIYYEGLTGLSNF